MSLSVRLKGDRTKARSLAEAHVNRLIREFRNLNAFQGLKQNARRVDLYDGENMAGHIFLKTVFGIETVEVMAYPTKERVVKVKKEDFKYCPVMKAITEDLQYVGYFVFLDGIISENVLFIPKVHGEKPAWNIDSGLAPPPEVWDPVDTAHGGYSVRGLSLGGGISNDFYGGFLLDSNKSIFSVYPDTESNVMLAMEPVTRNTTPLVDSPVTNWREQYDWDTAPNFNFSGAIWDPSHWCGAFPLISRYTYLAGEIPNRVEYNEFTYEMKFYLKSGSRLWSKTLLPKWQSDYYGPPDAGYDGVFLSSHANSRSYLAGGVCYLGYFRTYSHINVNGSEKTYEDTLYLTSPSFEGNSDVQAVPVSDVNVFADTDQGRAYPFVYESGNQHYYFDWALVKEV